MIEDNVYKKRCMITLECDSINIGPGRRSPSVYNNINYRDSGIIEFLINGLPAGISFNGYTDGGDVVALDLGTFKIFKGNNSLTLICRGSDLRGLPGNMAGIDMLKLTRLDIGR